MITFNPRWKEEIVATSDEGTLVFEMTMGVNHVYFPDENKWGSAAPVWAKGKWAMYAQACKNWCTNNNVPVTFATDAYMYEEKRRK